MHESKFLHADCISKLKESLIFCSKLSLVFQQLQPERFCLEIEVGQMTLQLVLELIVEFTGHLERLSF